MAAILIVKLLFFALLSSVSSRVTLINAGFGTPPTNLITNATSQFVLLDPKTNAIPGWTFKGTVWYVTAGGNVSLPGNGHGLQLGPNGMISQTFKSDESYYFVLTFTLAPSSPDCANNATAVNVSAHGISQVFYFKESFGTEMWQTYAFSLEYNEVRNGIMGLQVQSVATRSRGDNNITCWPIVDTFKVTGIGSPYFSDNEFGNSGFEYGPLLVENSSQGVLLEANSHYDKFRSVLQNWNVLGTVKYIDSKHYAVPRGSRAIELVSGNPSGIVAGSIANVDYLKHSQVTIDFVMGDANDSCVGDLTVFLQVGSMIWNFTMRSIGIGSREAHSVTFEARFDDPENVPISFTSYNETRTRDHNVLCGPVIDSTVLRFSSGLRSTKLYNKLVICNFVFVVIFLFFA